MTIKAFLCDGRIQPVEPLPSAWADGQELVVEEPEPKVNKEEISLWAQELDASTARMPQEEHDRFLKALDQIEQESKQAARKECRLP